ncbi:MAG: AAA family ATPase [Clostridia bacterium]
MNNVSLGISDFKKLRKMNYLYIDKSLYIKDLLDNTSEVIIVTRPRRFGKTLNMSMINYYFDITEDSIDIFNGLNIMNCESKYTEKINSTPVIYLTFKDVCNNSFDKDISRLKITMMDLYQKYYFLLDSGVLYEGEKKIFKDILNTKENEIDLIDAVKKLCEYLTRYYKIAPYILLDEYDVPLENAYSKGYYDEMIELFKSFFRATFKDNINIQKAILTGVSRIAKESIFSGMNNFKVYTILDDEFADDFGITQLEVDKIITKLGIEDKKEELAKWYNGYVIGKNTHVYNTWSILNYLDEMKFKPYWLNTSSNDIIEMIAIKSIGIKKQLELLLSGQSIDVNINEETILKNIENNEENIWGLLISTGYIKVEKQLERKKYRISIPNYEIKCFFEDIIQKWFVDKIAGENLTTILNDMLKGDIKTFEKKFKILVETMFSYYDVGKNNSENFYHAFVLGMLVELKDTYFVISNRESGFGRYDIVVKSKLNKLNIAIIMEFKTYEEDEKDLEQTLNSAMKQIESKKYETDLIQEGYTNIIKIAFAFKGKIVKILSKK